MRHDDSLAKSRATDDDEKITLAIANPLRKSKLNVLSGPRKKTFRMSNYLGLKVEMRNDGLNVFFCMMQIESVCDYGPKISVKKLDAKLEASLIIA